MGNDFNVNCVEKLLEPTIYFNLYTKSPYQNYEWDMLKLSSTCISFADSSKAVQILLIILNLYFMFLCCLHLKIQEVFHVYLNEFENAVYHLFLVILGNNWFPWVSLISIETQSSIKSSLIFIFLFETVSEDE